MPNLTDPPPAPPFSGNASIQDPYTPFRQQMVKEQIVRRGIENPQTIAALLKVPRHLFVSFDQIQHSYEDHPLSIGSNQTISQPYIVAYMTEKLQLTGKEKVLEIGTGSGYQTAILAETCREVFTIERIHSLGEEAEKKLTATLSYTNIHFKIGQGEEGWREHRPYDRILLTAAPETVPLPLFDQLADGGILLAPEGRLWQKLIRYRKIGETLEKEELIAVSFVPLVRE